MVNGRDLARLSSAELTLMLRRQIGFRRVFSDEGVMLAAVGWAVGVPVGWLIYEGLIAFVNHDFGIRVPVVYPAIAPPVALVAVIAVTLLVIRPPLRRATRVQAGGALRYQ
jgi:putative ABC transport system permease protein